MAFFDSIFLAHPRSVGETYTEHMKFAAWFSFQLLRAGSAAAVHSVIPRLCDRTASTIVKALARELADRSCKVSPPVNLKAPSGDTKTTQA